jgi:hypothetical protein
VRENTGQAIDAGKRWESRANLTKGTMHGTTSTSWNAQGGGQQQGVVGGAGKQGLTGPSRAPTRGQQQGAEHRVQRRHVRRLAGKQVVQGEEHQVQRGKQARGGQVEGAQGGGGGAGGPGHDAGLLEGHGEGDEDCSGGQGRGGGRQGGSEECKEWQSSGSIEGWGRVQPPMVTPRSGCNPYGASAVAGREPAIYSPSASSAKQS